MSGKNNYPGKGQQQAPPKYLNDFSKALASEVRVLLQEVGKLRDERRALQYEVAELLAVKSRHGPGGEFAPDWKPKQDVPAIEAPPPMPEPEEPGAVIQARPGWRTVRPKIERKPRQPKALAAAPAPPPPEPVKSMPAWAAWKPNPLISPQPRMATSSNPMPMAAPAPQHVPGLFGPRTPPPTGR